MTRKLVFEILYGFFYYLGLNSNLSDWWKIPIYFSNEEYNILISFYYSSLYHVINISQFGDIPWSISAIFRYITTISFFFFLLYHIVSVIHSFNIYIDVPKVRVRLALILQKCLEIYQLSSENKWVNTSSW